MTKKTNSPDFKAMAELRYQIRRFLRFSENAAREAGVEPQQHQLLLAVRGLPDDLKPTIGALAERMQLQHHSTVELVDRLVSEARKECRRYTWEAVRNEWLKAYGATDYTDDAA